MRILLFDVLTCAAAHAAKSVLLAFVTLRVIVTCDQLRSRHFDVLIGAAAHAVKSIPPVCAQYCMTTALCSVHDFRHFGPVRRGLSSLAFDVLTCAAAHAAKSFLLAFVTLRVIVTCYQLRSRHFDVLTGAAAHAVKSIPPACTILYDHRTVQHS